MGLFDELALSGIDGVERRLGARAALRALSALLDTMPAGRSRARAVLRGVRYAGEVGDEVALELLAARWADEPEARGSDARRAVGALLASGLVRAATALAEAEVNRTRGGYDEPSARYALGRCHEAAGAWDRALTEHETAAARGADQPRLRWHAEARAFRALVALGRRDEAATRAGALLERDLGERDEDRLLLAVTALGSAGRYRRAAALDVLERLAERSSVRREAIGASARHAERAGAWLTELEVERLRAILRHHPDPGAREAAGARLTALAALAQGRLAASGDPEVERLLPRARAVAEGSAAGPRPSEGARAQVAWLGLAAVAALRERDRHQARALLGELEDLLRAGARPEAPCWSAARLALRDAKLGPHGEALTRLLLEREGEPAPAGYVALAEALDERAGAEELALEAWRRAASRREPQARERLAGLLRLRGWRAADAGELERARALLREARRLATGA